MSTAIMKLEQTRHAGLISERSDTVRGDSCSGTLGSRSRYLIAVVGRNVPPRDSNRQHTEPNLLAKHDTDIGDPLSGRRDIPHGISERMDGDTPHR